MLDENILIFVDIFQFILKIENSKQKICYSMQILICCAAREETTIIEYYTAIFKLFCFYIDNKNDFVISRSFSLFYHLI